MYIATIYAGNGELIRTIKCVDIAALGAGFKLYLEDGTTVYASGTIVIDEITETKPNKVEPSVDFAYEQIRMSKERLLRKYGKAHK